MILGKSGNNNGANATQAPAGGVINLSKGAKINLSKKKPSLKKIMFGLGWDTNKYAGGYDFDLDASCFLVNAAGRTAADGFIFYNNLIGPNNCVIHQGDNRTGEGEGDDEQIYIDLDLVPANVEKIAIAVTIDQADERGQKFGDVSNAYCRLVDTETDHEEVMIDIGENYSIETAVIFCELYKDNGDWKLSTPELGFSGGLEAICRNFGLDVEYK